MDKYDLINFLRDNLKIRVSKELHTQCNDYEFTEKLQVQLLLQDGYDEIEIDSDYISINELRRN